MIRAHAKTRPLGVYSHGPCATSHETNVLVETYLLFYHPEKGLGYGQAVVSTDNLGISPIRADHRVISPTRHQEPLPGGVSTCPEEVSRQDSPVC